MSETLKQKTAKGLFWGAMNSTSTQVLNLIIGIALARLLSPGDYGIVGVLTIFTTIAGDLQSSGFTQGLVNIPHPTSRDYNSVFSFNVVVSIIMYATLFLCAPLIASFFHQPCLVSVSRVVFLTFLISSLGIAHGGYMTKNMMNKEMAIIGAVALITSGTVGITLAILGFSYWALAWQQVAYITAINIGRYICVKEWHPRLSLDFGPVRSMAGFAVKILVTKIINTISTNILTVIFGRLFTIHQVGNFSQAFKWNNMASSLVSNTTGQIAQTVLVEGKTGEDNGNERQLRIFRKMLQFTCFLAMPLMFGLALVADEFIIITIGEKWLECAPLLRILCISGAFMPIYTMYQNLAISRGRSDIFMWLNICQIISQITIILALYRYGMTIMILAYSLFLILWLLPWHAYSSRLISYRWKSLFADTLPFIITSAIVMIATYFLTSAITSPLLLIATRFIIAAILYYAFMRLLNTDILQECERFVLRKR